MTVDLLERAGELDKLSAAVGAAGAGEGCLVIVEGPAGIGKSSLLAASQSCAAGEGFEVLSVRGDVLIEASPFAAVRELFGTHARSLTASSDPGAEARLAAPVFTAGGWGDVDRDRAGAVLQGLHRLTLDLAQERPLALVVDDAQWLDAASKRFLLYLAGRLAGPSVALIVGVRPGDSEDDVGFRAALTQHARVVLRPQPLSREGSDALVRGELGPRADERLCRMCYESTKGNPFYLRELAIALRDQGVRASAELASRGREVRVTAIAANVLVRLARLGADCGRFAEALAVLGPGSRLRTVALLADLPPDRARVAADRLHETELIVGGLELAFVHPIVNEVVGGEIPPAHRAALHGSAARLLSDLQTDESVGRVGAHLLLSEPYADQWVVKMLRDAAADALSRGAPEAAVPFLQRASDEPPPPELRLTVLRELGRAEALLPTAQDFATLRHALVQARTPSDRAEISYELALALFGVFRNSEAIAVLDEVLSTEEFDKPVADRLEAALIGGGIGDLHESPRLLERAVRHFERARRGEIDEPLLLSSLAQAAAVGGGTADEATSLARRSMSDGRLLSDGLNAGYIGAVIGLSFSDRLLEATAAIEDGMREAQRRGSAPMQLQFSFFGADAALRAGDLDRAEECARRAFALGDDLGVESLGRIWLPIVLLHRGHPEQAASILEDISLPPPADLLEAGLMVNRGRVRIALGQCRSGLEDLLEVDRLSRSAHVRPWIDWVPSAAAALVLLGEEQRARQLAGRELEQAAAFAAPRRHGIALATCGRLDSGETGIARLEEAAEMLESCGATLDRAQTLVHLGTAMHRLGARSAARSRLAEALETADACGAWALAAQARAALISTGARPRRAARAGPRSLTPAEQRVVTLAIEGLTNREIAQSLFLSVKTVEGQLSHAYAKLNVSSRSQLADVLRNAQ